MRYKAGPARLSRIETENETYRITTRDDTESLATSIETSGLINPPVLLPAKDKSTCVIVCGFRRIAACKYLGWNRVDARFLDPDTPHTQCVQAAIAENCTQRELNLIEKSRAIKLLSDSLADDDAAGTMAGKAGLSVAPAILATIRSLCSLPVPFQRGLIAGTLSLSMAKKLQCLPSEDAREAYDLFCEIRAGLNVQREILDNAEESARREGVNIIGILRSAAMLKIRASDESDRSHKTGQIRKLLKERRYPALSAAEETFARRSGALGLRRDMKLVPPAGFEGPDYSLNLKFRSREQLLKQKDVIERLLTSEALKDILD
ncbi:MAG: ParB N-terminal domain-containing protein [Desulfobacterales bacterium]|nr:ParB N-terminal domain-containing protein [Desulfobacterales bacterium]